MTANPIDILQQHGFNVTPEGGDAYRVRPQRAPAKTMLGIETEERLIDALVNDTLTAAQLADRVEAITADLHQRMGDAEPFALSPNIAARLATALGLDEPLPARGWMPKVADAIRRMRQEAEARERIRQQTGEDPARADERRSRMSLSCEMADSVYGSNASKLKLGAAGQRYSLDGRSVKVVEQFGDGSVLVEHANGSRLHTMANKLTTPGGGPPAPDGWVQQAIDQANGR